MIGQPEDLRGKLSGSLGGEDRGAAKTCREEGSVTMVNKLAFGQRHNTGSAMFTAWHTEG